MTNKDSILLMDIYRRYLQVTADLVEILERNYEAINNGGSQEEKNKREEFIKHAQGTIESFNEDLHKLLKISWELRELEKKLFQEIFYIAKINYKKFNS